jgi:hypothetical protein
MHAFYKPAPLSGIEVAKKNKLPYDGPHIFDILFLNKKTD